MNKEPVAIGGGLTAVAVAAIPFLRAFGVNITQEQADATLGLLAALVAFGTLLVRSKVTPVAKAERKITEAFHANPKVDPKPALK